MKSKKSKESNLKRILLVLLVVVLLYAGMALIIRAIGLDNIQQAVQQAGPLAPLLFLVVCSMSLILAPISGSSFFVVGGVIFGHEVGFLLSYLGSLIGCSSNFWISRKLGRQVAGQFIGNNNLEALDRFTKELKSHHSIFYIILAMPLAQDLVSYAVGLTKVKFWQFFLALAISTIAIVGAYIYLGSNLLEALL